MAKFIRFEESALDGKPAWKVVNKRAGDIIGVISWYAPWKTHICQFDPNSIWSRDCLVDVAEFMGTLKKGG